MTTPQWTVNDEGDTRMTRTTVTIREFEEALDRIERLLDVSDGCLDGDECDMWRDECQHHSAVDFLASYGRDVEDE